MMVPELLVDIDRRSALPLQSQLFDAIRAMVLDGRLAPNFRLPSSRDLAGQLNIGRNTVIAVYERLTAEGYVSSARGGGTRITALSPDLFLTAGAARIAPASKAKSDQPPTLSNRGAQALQARGLLPVMGLPAAFIAGQPDISEFPHDKWAKLLASAVRRVRPGDLGYGWVGGWPDLRQAIAEQVGATRRVLADAEQVIITTGTQAALVLASQLLSDPGDRVLMEDPGYLGARGVFTAAGNRVTGVPVDSQGMDIDRVALDQPTPKLIYTTPSHQFPTGATLSLARRLRLLEFAAQSGAYILEDDYDSEFRFEGRPLSSLQGLSVERQGTKARVIYIGTFAKTLFPALRVGFLIAPPGLGSAFAAAARNVGVMPPIHIQAALAQFLTQGDYAAHVRRMRLIYKRRQGLLIKALRAHFDESCLIGPPEGGMQLAFRPDGSVPNDQLPHLGLARGLTLNLLSRLYLHPDSPAARGLHLGFAAIPDDQITPAARVLAEICRP